MKLFPKISVLCVVVLFLSAGLAIADDLTVSNYQLISSKRVSRVEYEYTYKADVTNTGPDVKNVMAMLTSNSPNTAVVDGILDFGDVPAGAAKTSTNTFTIKQNRRYPLNWNDLVWKTAHGEAVGVIGPEGGVVEVTDNSSPIYGAKLTVPPGALDREVPFGVLYDRSKDNEDFLAKPIIIVHPDVVFYEDVILALPLKLAVSEVKTLMIMWFDEEMDLYVPTGLLIDVGENDTFAVLQLPHVSRFALQPANPIIELLSDNLKAYFVSLLKEILVAKINAEAEHSIESLKLFIASWEVMSETCQPKIICNMAKWIVNSGLRGILRCDDSYTIDECVSRLEENLFKMLRLLSTSNINLCDKLGQTQDVFYPTEVNNGIPTDWAGDVVTITDTYHGQGSGLNCMGRCGEGCPEDENFLTDWLPCEKYFIYTQACLNHDACVRSNPLGVYAPECTAVSAPCFEDCKGGIKSSCENAREVCGDGYDNNGNGEIDEGCESPPEDLLITYEDATLTLIDSQTRTDKWSVKLDSIVYGAANDSWVVAIDVNGDQNRDYVVKTMQSVTTLNGIDGSIIWRYPLPPLSKEIAQEIHLVDLNNDGVEEIICTHNSIHAFNINGTHLWEDYIGQPFWTLTAIYDIDQDGRPDIVGEVGHGGPAAAADLVTRTMKWTYNSFPSYMVNGRPAFIDSDEDGCFESYWPTYGNRFTILDCNGSLFWQSPSYGSGWDPQVFYSRNVDGTGRPNIVVGTLHGYKFNNDLYLIDAETGAQVWKFNHPNTYWFIQPIVIEDVNGNGKKEIICRDNAGGGSTRIFAVNGDNGSLIWEIPTGSETAKVPSSATAERVIADTDADGYLEFIYWQGNTVFVQDASTGNPVWNYSNSGTVRFAQWVKAPQ